MQIVIKKSFLKMYAMQRSKVQESFKDRRDLFLVNKFDPLLKNHKLHDIWAGYRSINITGDIRALYIDRKSTVIFVAIGIHNELYKK